jgi:hypothetical protein
MYPNLYYAFKDIFGVEWTWLKLVNSFGFFVALSFIFSAWILTLELRRKQQQGLFEHTEETITIGKPASLLNYLLNFIIGFVFGYKIIGAFMIADALNDPQSFHSFFQRKSSGRIIDRFTLRRIEMVGKEQTEISQTRNKNDTHLATGQGRRHCYLRSIVWIPRRQNISQP